MKKRIGLDLGVKRGPCDDVWDRLLGQFWLRLAWLANDLPEGPRRQDPTIDTTKTKEAS